MNSSLQNNFVSRGELWLQALTPGASELKGYPASVRVIDASLAQRPARYLAVLPDAENRFPRARNGEIGLLEGWHLAQAVQDVIARDQEKENKTVLVAVIDVSSQAYGRREEGYGIHQALAAAAGAYAQARLAGHAVIGLIVGKAMSGAFLAHGYQANRLIAIDDAGVMVHAMGKESAARITLRSVEALETLAATIPPMAYDIRSYASLGLLWKLLTLQDVSQPVAADIALVQDSLQAALLDIENDTERDLRARLTAGHRSASAKVRQMLREQW